MGRQEGLFIKEVGGEISRGEGSWLTDLAGVYCQVFNNQSGFGTDNYQPEQVRGEIVRQMEGADARLWVAVTNNAPQAIIGFMWVMGKMSGEEMQEEIVGSMTKFGDQDVREYEEVVSGAISEWGESRIGQTAYVAEFGVMEEYRGGKLDVASKLMWELAKYLKKERESKYYSFWTIDGDVMQKIMKKQLRGGDWMKFTDERKSILMKGEVGIATRMLGLANRDYEKSLGGK